MNHFEEFEILAKDKVTVHNRGRRREDNLTSGEMLILVLLAALTFLLQRIPETIP
jgi:hypothetical protein